MCLAMLLKLLVQSNKIEAPGTESSFESQVTQCFDYPLLCSKLA